mmetsp:Transcript_53830/g.166802  ORF Transcript_53830/g.166802 Transcript_53830/m.166802 type:complete len:352 (+) Transcript_53830:251-1306(+)
MRTTAGCLRKAGTQAQRVPPAPLAEGCHSWPASAWPPEKRMWGESSRTKGSQLVKGCVGRVSGAVGARWDARRQAAKAARGEPREVHLRRSSTGWPACPRTLTPSTLHSYGLVTDLKSRQLLTRLKRCGCSGICGSVRFVGSPRPGITSTRREAARRASVSSASCSTALVTEPAELAAKVPPQTTSRRTASPSPPSPKRKPNARERASAKPAPASASPPKAKPEAKAKKGPSPVAPAGSGSGGGQAILGKQRALTLKRPSSVAQPRTPTMAPVAKEATCSLDATSCRRMEVSSSQRTSSSELSLWCACASLFSPSALDAFMVLYWSMTLGRSLSSLKSTPMITASPQPLRL